MVQNLELQLPDLDEHYYVSKTDHIRYRIIPESYFSGVDGSGVERGAVDENPLDCE